MIYLDHAATSFPKHPEVTQAIATFMNVAANPGRSGHPLSLEAARIIYSTRDRLADFFQSDPMRVIFTRNATESINIVLQGLLNPGDTVLVSDMEHNAVMRPLHAIASRGIHIRKVSHSQILDALNPQIALLICSHGNNVDGNVYPIDTYLQKAKACGVKTLIDAAQTAGLFQISTPPEYLAITGHKALGGPPGIGALILSETAPIPRPLIYGGTGSKSDKEIQPDFLPDHFESGTLNGIGIAGFGAALERLTQTTYEERHAHKQRLIQYLIEGLSTLPGLHIYAAPPEHNSGIVSVATETWRVDQLAHQLATRYEIYTRPGLHCAPAAHHVLGTYPTGTLRLSIGATNTSQEIEQTIRAFQELIHG